MTDHQSSNHKTVSTGTFFSSVTNWPNYWIVRTQTTEPKYSLWNFLCNRKDLWYWPLAVNSYIWFCRSIGPDFKRQKSTHNERDNKGLLRKKVDYSNLLEPLYVDILRELNSELSVSVDGHEGDIWQLVDELNSWLCNS